MRADQTHRAGAGRRGRGEETAESDLVEPVTAGLGRCGAVHRASGDERAVWGWWITGPLLCRKFMCKVHTYPNMHCSARPDESRPT
ncbi:hypothetical protein GCM10023191_072260 [Actinoallomurus oryzae]|uniref:Uncharacterized protein n=1 Tax=Actinoallomurus oryzae TaxID=502180 RepID=A0ABP8QU50_9ACTN